MAKHKKPEEGRHSGQASWNPGEAGQAGARRNPANTGSPMEPKPAKPSSHEEMSQGNPDAPGQRSPGDYQSLPADLDGMHNDSWNPAVQAAGSVEEAADAARQAAHAAGGAADPLFTGSPGEEGPAPNIPSTLNMNTGASAARTGREQMKERQGEQMMASPAVTGGDVDADWMSGEFVGDETPAGDNPTPGMSVVEDVGHAMGVDYQDTEELKGAEKIEERDRHRWELDPASSEDYAERNKDDDKQ
jgi:hypothetical protein